MPDVLKTHMIRSTDEADWRYLTANVEVISGKLPVRAVGSRRMNATCLPRVAMRKSNSAFDDLFPETRLMNPHISLHILDTALRKTVCVRELGVARRREDAAQLLGRPATLSLNGDWWMDVDPLQIAKVAADSHFNHFSPADVYGLAAQFPPPKYCWMILEDY